MELDTASQSQYRLLHELPVELVKHIFELAASSKVVACALCLVSRTVHEWTLPHLYGSIVFTNFTAIKRWNLFYYNTIQDVTRGSAAHIRSLMLKTGPCERLITKDCLNIRHLAIVPHLEWYFSINHRATQRSSLTHAALHGALYVHQLSLPVFRTVTHIHIPDDIPFYGNEFSPANLPNLTHIVWTLIPEVDFRIGNIFPRWIQALHKFTTLRLVAVYVYSISKLPFDMDLTSASLPTGVNIFDIPIFLIEAAQLWTESDSENWILGGESIWERTERVLIAQGIDITS